MGDSADADIENGDPVLYGTWVAIASLGSGLIAASYGYEVVGMALALPAIAFIAIASGGAAQALQYLVVYLANRYSAGRSGVFSNE